MSPKPTLELEVVIEAALAVVREQGGAALNARKLASRLGTSTMPIYSSVGSMGALDGLVRQRIATDLQAWQNRSWSSNPLLDMAIGYVMYARDEPRLFLHLLSKPADGQAEDMGKFMKSDEAAAYLKSVPAYDAFIAGMAQDRQNDFVFQTWIYVHGLATLVAEGLFVTDQAELTRRLESAGAAFYVFHLQQSEEIQHGNDA